MTEIDRKNRVVGRRPGGASRQAVSSRAARAARMAGAVAGAVVVGWACGESPEPMEPSVATSLQVSPASVGFVALEQSEQATATILDQYGDPMSRGPDYWVAEDPRVAAVTSTGLITARGVGTTTVTVALGLNTAEIAVTVVQELATLSVEQSEPELFVGDEIDVDAAGFDANSFGIPDEGLPALTWSSSNEDIATVQGDGASAVIEGLRQGEVTITVSGGSASADFSVTVNASPPRRIYVTPYRRVITALGSTTTFNVRVVAENGSIIADPDVQWASLDPAVASVDSEGAVTSVKVGVAEIEGSIAGLADTAQVIVRQDVASLNLSPASTTLNPGEQVEVTVSAVDANGYEIPDEALPAIDWGNTDSQVARRTDDGAVGAKTIAVTGLRGGTTEITARADDGEGSASVTVDDPSNGNFAPLWELYHAMGGDGWTQSDNWLTSEPVGTWHGVTLDSEGRIAELDLSDNGLSGEIWGGIGELAHLERLDFSNNYGLESPIPNGVFDLAKLQELNLSRSNVQGSMGAGIGNLKQLRTLNLSFSSVTGSLPSSMGGMESLESLLLEGVPDLTGNIPASVGGISGLRRLVLTGNGGMQGSVPKELAQLASLEEFSIADTGLCVDFIVEALRAWVEQIDNASYFKCPSSLGPAYLVQSIQAFHDPVPLVAGEDALLRVFVIATEESDYGLPRTVASFYQGGVVVHEAHIPSQSTIIPTDTIENDLTQSVNAVIPGNVLQPGVEIVIKVDPGDEVPEDLGLIRRIPFEGTIALDVRNLPTFRTTLIPMLWSSNPDTDLEEQTNALTADSEELELSHHLMGFHDWHLIVDDPFYTSYNPLTNWSSALGALNSYRINEGTGRFYFGTQTWVVSGILGIAYRPGRTMLSVIRPDVIAHEWGHNLVLYHAPCGGPAGVDPDYPYPGAAIGSWGYDRGTEELVDPDVVDVMSYCDDPWISGYNLKMILDYRIGVDAMEYGRVGVLPGPREPVLLVRGRRENGALVMDPSFVLDAPAELPTRAGPYRIRGLSTDGKVVFSYLFNMQAIEDGDGVIDASFTFAIPGAGAWSDRLSEIILDGPEGTFRMGPDSVPVEHFVFDPSGRLRAIIRDEPGMSGANEAARMANQFGAAGSRILVSRGVPGPEGKIH